MAEVTRRTEWLDSAPEDEVVSWGKDSLRTLAEEASTLDRTGLVGDAAKITLRPLMRDFWSAFWKRWRAAGLTPEDTGMFTTSFHQTTTVPIELEQE